MKRPIHCPKCNWILNVEKDHYGWFVECISCGFTRDIKLLQVKSKTGAAAKKH
jgi:DNA-directed RNA polymerase subunit M/transcription elongation factor TFIIS